MNTYKLIISYDGTNFYGWQKQPLQQTIQGELNSVLIKICKSQQIKTIGSGRTDAGVHAYGQVVKVELPLSLSCDALLAGINSLICKEIRVLSIQKCTPEFHPIFSAHNKTYLYLFSNEKIQSPMIKNFVAHYPFEFDLHKMAKACKVFEGEHDFLAFSTRGTKVTTTVRKILNCHILLKNDPFLGRHFEVSITGTGFLKQMVRLMVGSIMDVGRGKLECTDICEVLKSGEDRKISAVAAPQGLYLDFVTYPSF